MKLRRIGRLLLKGTAMTNEQVMLMQEKLRHDAEMEAASRARKEAEDRRVRQEILDRQVAPVLARMKGE